MLNGRESKDFLEARCLSVEESTEGISHRRAIRLMICCFAYNHSWQLRRPLKYALKDDGRDVVLRLECLHCSVLNRCSCTRGEEWVKWTRRQRWAGGGGWEGGREGERDMQIYRDDDQYTNLEM